MNTVEIRRSSPALAWNEAFPLGNGRMGVMAYCDPVEALFDLSESTFVSGLPPRSDPASEAPPGAPEAFMRAREASIHGDYAKMEAELAGFIGKKGEYGTNLPIGQLRLSIAGLPTTGKDLRSCERMAGYERVLHLDSGTVEWCGLAGGCELRWKAFISAMAGVLAIRVESELPFALEVSMRAILPPLATERSGDDFRFSARALEGIHSSGDCGVSAAGLVRIRYRDREISRRADVFVAIETDFPTAASVSDPGTACALRIRDAESAGFEGLLAEHVAEHRNLFDRVSLDLGEGEAERAATLFQFGRYLLMSSSRPDSPLPAHLQGVWNDAVACRIGWTCDFHLDVNTQMNYWPAESARLPECALPLYRWIGERLVPEGMKTARSFYGMPGWAGELCANAYGRASPYWHLNIAPYPTGGAWLAAQLGEHYLYSGDRDFLSATLLPILEGAVEFFLAYLFEGPGGSGLASGPSISPENMFLDGSTRRRASISPTCEIAVIRETLLTYVQACRELGIADRLAGKAESALARLPSLKTASGGELSEWSHDMPSADPNHRHMSHLLGLYPFRQIAGSAGSAATCSAAAESMRRRTAPAELWEDTGWARSALALYAARLGDGKALQGHLRELSEKLAFPNLMIRHPPTRGAPAFADVYELDGNTGFTAAVAEALIRSSRGAIDLLPALPPFWPSGSARGLGAPEGLVVDLDWKDGKLRSCTLRAAGATYCRVSYGSLSAEVRLVENETLKLGKGLRRLSGR